MCHGHGTIFNRISIENGGTSMERISKENYYLDIAETVL